MLKQLDDELRFVYIAPPVLNCKGYSYLHEHWLQAQYLRLILPNKFGLSSIIRNHMNATINNWLNN